jgi:hypothetical protein
MEHASWSNNPALRNNLMLLADALQFVIQSLRALTELTVAYKNNSLLCPCSFPDTSLFIPVPFHA